MIKPVVNLVGGLQAQAVNEVAARPIVKFVPAFRVENRAQWVRMANAKAKMLTSRRYHDNICW